MADFSELTTLFSRLATSRRRHPPDASEEIAAAISSLASSLDPHTEYLPPSGVRVLDAALSLMCFKASEVWRSNVELLAETITTVLSSSVSCKVLRSEVLKMKGRERLVVGGSFRYGGCEKMVEACLGVLDSLKGHELCIPMLRALLEVIISTSAYWSLSPMLDFYYCENEARSVEDRRALLSKLSCCISEDLHNDNHVVPPRLIFWQLDPLNLKTDISNILWDFIQRPFLDLRKQFHERPSWRSIVICMASSPTIFSQTRALLHNWFLLTDLNSILDLQSTLISSLLDLLLRPMRWGLSMETGLIYPFPPAYFPVKHRQLLCILRGPISFRGLADLVDLIGKVSPSAQCSSLTSSYISNISKHATDFTSSLGPKSAWAMLLAFPKWYHFASMLLFTKKDLGIFSLNKSLSEAVEKYGDELYKYSTVYIAAMLCPFNQALRDTLVSSLHKVALSWSVQVTQGCSFQQGSQFENTFSKSKKLRKSRNSTTDKILPAGYDFSLSMISLWLEQFHDSFKGFNDGAIWCSISDSCGEDPSCIWTCQIIHKIPLGILMANSKCLDDKVFELLLHYSATGELLHLEESQIFGVQATDSKIPRYSNTAGYLKENDTGKWLSGASLVLDLFDIVEDIAVALFHSESAHLDYICLMKGKTLSYLVKCTENLLKLSFQAEGCVEEIVKMTDLYNRLLAWKQLGRELFDGCQIFENLLSRFRTRIEVANLQYQRDADLLS